MLITLLGPLVEVLYRFNEHLSPVIQTCQSTSLQGHMIWSLLKWLSFKMAEKAKRAYFTYL